MTNPFEAGGAAYAANRPTYPPALAKTLAGLVERHKLAVDVGCGSGQLSVLLADHFDEVLGLDPSDSQLSGAAAHPRVRYQCAPAEALPVADGAAALITAAQAAHWFDRPKFYAEVRRIAAPGAVLALITYNNAEFDAAARAPIMALYRALDPWWRPERVDVETGYARFEFPFEGFDVDGGVIERDWEFAAMRAYLETWSALRAAREAGQGAMIEDHLARAESAWGERVLRVTWPITVRAGRV
jgi:Methylase involved in ubiquinone/menaquinone biosynthesis